jgi:hypothetical protein
MQTAATRRGRATWQSLCNKLTALAIATLAFYTYSAHSMSGVRHTRIFQLGEFAT